MSDEYLLVRALKGEITERVPFWFMRQAGRYLPEYRELRKTANGFLDLCFTPEKASEVTIQPIRRFGMDGAILFSDILVIPYALGADVRFAEGEGPIVEQTITAERIGQLRLDDVRSKLDPVAQTVKLTRRDLPKETALIGFAGSPWTVACYMLQGDRGKASVKEFATAKRFAYAQPALMQKLTDILTDATIDYLKLQIESGVQAVQLFDSWAGLLSPEEFDRWSIAPTQKIAAALRAAYPHIPLIGFAKGAGPNLARYAAQTGVNAIGIDQHTPMEWAIAQRAHARQAVQGNLDPLLVAANKDAAVAQTHALLKTLGRTPCVLNLGHGFVPDTPIENVAAVADTIKNFRR
jgi:uroporphyrinogen decarboxylase